MEAFGQPLTTQKSSLEYDRQWCLLEISTILLGRPLCGWIVGSGSFSDPGLAGVLRTCPERESGQAIKLDPHGWELSQLPPSSRLGKSLDALVAAMRYSASVRVSIVLVFVMEGGSQRKEMMHTHPRGNQT